MKQTCTLLAAALSGAASLLAQTPVPVSIPAQSLLSQQAGAMGAVVRDGVNIVAMPRAETGKPFSATLTTQTTQTLLDGTHVNRTTTVVTYRDADGRTRMETSAPQGQGNETVKRIAIRDPVAGVAYNLDPAAKTAMKMATSAPPVFTGGVVAARGGSAGFGGGGGARGGGGGGGGRGGRGGMTDADPVAEGAKGLPNTNVEDLGSMMVNGVPARGTRITTVIPVGAIGNDREFRSVDERWYSPDLNMMIKTVSTDPRFGTTTYEATSISRANPDRSLFEPPADYKVNVNGPRQ
jgi:hypothetical protein